jgi:hypothetical protein
MSSGRKSQRKKAHQKAEEYEDEAQKYAVMLLNIKNWHTLAKCRVNEKKKQIGDGQEIG